jgi:hypothetical protein
VRDEVLGANLHDFRSFATKLAALPSHGVSVVVGSQSALEQANTQITDESKKFVLEPAYTDNSSANNTNNIDHDA